PRRLEQLARARDDQLHRRVPRRLLQLAFAAHERARQPIRRVVRLPAVQTLRPEPAVVDTVLGATAHAHDPAVCHGDVEPATIRAQHAGRLHPPFNLGLPDLQLRIHPHGPFAAAPERAALAPDVHTPSWRAHRTEPDLPRRAGL